MAPTDTTPTAADTTVVGDVENASTAKVSEIGSDIQAISEWQAPQYQEHPKTDEIVKQVSLPRPSELLNLQLTLDRLSTTSRMRTFPRTNTFSTRLVAMRTSQSLSRAFADSPRCVNTSPTDPSWSL